MCIHRLAIENAYSLNQIALRLNMVGKDEPTIGRRPQRCDSARRGSSCNKKKRVRAALKKFL